MKLKNFSLQGTNDLNFELNNFSGKKLVIYFYPKDSTPGCTNEGIDFSTMLPEFKAKNCEVFGISRDSLKSHENFKKKYNFDFELLSDPDETACNIFDVIKMKNMYGKQVRGIERSTFVIDEDGQIIKEWRGVKVNGHVDEVLEFLSS
jgi:thioredoxin-dependent peroxiredoxin